MAFINDTSDSSKPEVTNNIFGYVYINTQTCRLTVPTHTEQRAVTSPFELPLSMYECDCMYAQSGLCLQQLCRKGITSSMMPKKTRTAKKRDISPLPERYKIQRNVLIPLETYQGKGRFWYHKEHTSYLFSNGMWATRVSTLPILDRKAYGFSLPSQHEYNLRKLEKVKVTGSLNMADWETEAIRRI